MFWISVGQHRPGAVVWANMSGVGIGLARAKGPETVTPELGIRDKTEQTFP